MKKYCIIDQSFSPEEGWCPNIPDDTYFLLIADPNNDVHWALYSVDFENEDTNHKSVLFVSDELENLLVSAESFPPSIALARDKINTIFKNENPSKEIFLEKYSECLKEYFKSQRNNKYIFAEALIEESGYLSNGSFYWVIGYNEKDNEFLWVSTDYVIYKNPANDFNIDDSEKKKLAENNLNL